MSSPESTTRSVIGESKAAPGNSPVPQASRSTSSLAATQTVVAPASARLAMTQWIIAGTLVFLASLAALRLAMVEGLARVARIDGPSMAPAFFGGHYCVTCEDCRFVFRVDAEHAPANRQATCPNCGYPTNALRDDELVAGDAVVIDHWPLALRRPHIGEVVAAADPDNPTDVVIKRVASLPGQSLAVRGGELFHGGRLVRKSWHELAQVRILVHDNTFQPTKTMGLPDRWKGADGPARWHAAGNGFRCEAAKDGSAGDPAAKDEGLDWLQYQHHQMFGWHSRTRLSAVLDLDSYNPSATRLLNTVPDVSLSCRLQARGSGRFALAVVDGPLRFEAIVEPAKRVVTLNVNGNEIERKPLAHDFSRRGVEVEFGLCDQQVFLRVASRQMFRHAYERTVEVRDIKSPLAIGAEKLALHVSELRVWRDIYYLAPDGAGRDWSAESPAAAGTLNLLGDNASVSIDSRQWERRVALSQVRGVVYRPFWAAGESR